MNGWIEWVEAPASAAIWGTTLVGGAVLLLTFAFVGLGVACLWMKPARADRAFRVMEELRLLVTAFRGKAPPSEGGHNG